MVSGTIEAAGGARAPRPAVAYWLYIVAALVFAMVLLGGATRLTQSGLSMVDWRPLMGAIPPLGEAAWQDLFRQYQSYPEYRAINRGMSLAEFKTIFWFEYAHRLLGRGIALVFFLPFAWNLARRRLERPLALRLLGVLLLGGVQGLVGWWMVKSGLVEDPEVSQYRLATHLSLALVIYLCILWLALGLGDVGARERAPPRPWFALLVGLAVLVQAVSGALVAGLDAGLLHNTFPTMTGAWVPDELFDLQPWWLNHFENATTVQFNHRVGAMAVVLLVGALVWRCRRAGRAARRAANWLLAAVLLQFVLGVVALVHMVPTSLGVAHQAGALLLLTAWLVTLNSLARPREHRPADGFGV